MCNAGEWGRSGSLTSAEQAVLRLALEGLSNRAIARSRGVALRTVANQLAVIYRKLKLSGRRELWAFGTASMASAAVAPRAWWRRGAPSSRGMEPMTTRERQVCELASAGLSNKSIAFELGVSTGSISKHLTRAGRKFVRAAQA